MTTARQMTSFLASAAVALAALAPSARASDDTAVGYKFQKAPVNSLGITGFEDLRGKPVLIDFWGTR